MKFSHIIFWVWTTSQNCFSKCFPLNSRSYQGSDADSFWAIWTSCRRLPLDWPSHLLCVIMLDHCDIGITLCASYIHADCWARISYCIKPALLVLVIWLMFYVCMYPVIAFIYVRLCSSSRKVKEWLQSDCFVSLPFPQCLCQTRWTTTALSLQLYWEAWLDFCYLFSL